MKKLIVIGLLALSAISFGNSSMTNNIKKVNTYDFSDQNLFLADWDESTFGWEQIRTEDNQRRLIRSQPPIKMTDSLERKQINQRTELWNDAYKVSYLYVFLEGVGCLGYYTIKGKISSVNSSVTNPEQVLRSYSGSTSVVSAPAEDGSYGTNGDGIFAFATDGAYMETNLKYFLSDKPIKLSSVELGTINR